jgi:uncharacterized protein YndB with AHSA1/START domain
MAVAIKKQQEHELFLTRTFNAPIELVFKAWTDPAMVVKWWGPKGYTNPVCEVDPHIGGKMRIHMRAPDGTVYPMTGVFESLVEPTQIVFTSAALRDGKPMFEIRNTVTLAPTDEGKTVLTLRATVTMAEEDTAQYLDGMEMGWTQSLDKLADLLADPSARV